MPTILEQVEASLANADHMREFRRNQGEHVPDEAPFVKGMRSMARILRAADGSPLTAPQRRDFATALEGVKEHVAHAMTTDPQLPALAVSDLMRGYKAFEDGTSDPEAAFLAVFRYGKATPNRGKTMDGETGSTHIPGRLRGDPDSLGARYIDLKMQSGMKGLLEIGSVAVPMAVRLDPIADPRRAKFLWQLLAEETAMNGMASYLRQKTRVLAAAVVAEGAVKPTSTFTLERVDARLKVIAHITDPIDRFAIEDAPLLQQFLDDELAYGLNLALDSLVVSDLLAVATSAGVLVTLPAIRTAITALQLLDIEPNAIALNPTDWATVEAAALLAFAANSNVGPNEEFARKLYGVPIVVTTALTAGTAIIGDFGGAALFVDGSGIRIDASVATPRVVGPDTVSDFQLNQMIFRAERRALPAITAPTKFAKLAV